MKKACVIKDFKNVENPKYKCKKCGAKVDKREKICKPEKI